MCITSLKARLHTRPFYDFRSAVFREDIVAIFTCYTVAWDAGRLLHKKSSAPAKRTELERKSRGADETTIFSFLARSILSEFKPTGSWPYCKFVIYPWKMNK